MAEYGRVGSASDWTKENAQRPGTGGQIEPSASVSPSNSGLIISRETTIKLRGTTATVGEIWDALANKSRSTVVKFRYSLGLDAREVDQITMVISE